MLQHATKHVNMGVLQLTRKGMSQAEPLALRSRQRRRIDAAAVTTVMRHAFAVTERDALLQVKDFHLGVQNLHLGGVTQA